MKALSRSIIAFLLLTNCVFSQSEVVLPRHEHRPYFQLKQYPQGLDKDSMQMIFTNMDMQQKISWKNKDSLDFFVTLVVIDEFDDALAVKKRIRHFEPRNFEELQIIQYLYSYKRHYDQLKHWLDFERKNYPESSNFIDYRIRIHEVEYLILSNSWSSEDSLVFKELNDPKWKSMTKGSDVYLQALIPLVQNIDQALRAETKYELKSNVALALAFYEFGIFLDKHVSTTDAFIALAIAKFYDKFNPDVNEKFRLLRSKMNERKLIFPSMRQLFPKQGKGFFNIESIQKRRNANSDTSNILTMNPEALKRAPVEEKSILKDHWVSIIVIVGLLILLLFVIFFVRVKN